MNVVNKSALIVVWLIMRNQDAMLQWRVNSKNGLIKKTSKSVLNVELELKKMVDAIICHANLVDTNGAGSVVVPIIKLITSGGTPSGAWVGNIVREANVTSSL